MNKSASQTKQSAAKPLSPTQGILQRKCACGNHTIAGGECEECSKKKKDGLQRKAINQSEPTNIPPIVHEILNSPGQPLDAETRTFMEPRFGHDFSNVQVHTGSLPSARSALTVNQPGDVYEQNADSIARKVVSGFLPTKSTPCKAYDFSAVRVHTGPTASRAAEAVQAHAFTLGHDIVFGAGEYAPNTSAGRELLAHELTHVVQQAPHLARKEKSAQQGACLFPGGYSEGKGHWGEFNGEPTYFIWGTWRSRDTHKQFLRRIFNIWISSTFGDISPNARARILSLLERIEIYIQEPMPGCQYPTGVSVQDLANIAQLARADMQRRLAAGREARGREEEAGLPPMPRTTEPPVLAQVQPGAARAETLTEQKAGQKAAPIPSTGSEFRGGTSGVRANTPALPATLTGADFGPAGGTGVYTMHLDYRIAGSSLLSQVVEAMNWVNYHWELFDITALARKGLKEQAAKQHRHKPTSKETEVGKMAAAGAEFRRVGERLAEEERTSHERLVQPPSEGETSGEVAERIVANYVNLELMPASTIVGYGGAALGALADLMGGEFQERGIPWPKTEGVYLVRCVAQPDPQGKEGEIRRAPSVAIKIVEVKFVQKLAKEALELPEAQIAEKELELEAEKRRDPPDLSRISRLEKELQDLKTGISGTSLDAIEVAIRKKQEQKREATGRRKEQLEEEIKKLEAQSEFAKKRAGEFTGTIYRPRATLVSEVTGDTYPLLLQVGEIAHEGSTYTYRISDVSTESGKWYEGKGTNPKMAVENAANKMARDNEYGRGSLAFRMPEEWQRLYGKLDLSLRSAPRDLALARQRLNDLVTVLVALSLFVPGVGEVAMVLGAAVAAERLIERARMGTLRLDAAAVGDVLGVLGAAASGAAIVGKIRVVRAYGRFILATTEADEAALVKAASSLSSAKTAVRIAEIGNEIVNWGGFGFGAIVTLDELLKINEEEAKGSISHAEARRN